MKLSRRSSSHIKKFKSVEEVQVSWRNPRKLKKFKSSEKFQVSRRKKQLLWSRTGGKMYQPIGAQLGYVVCSFLYKFLPPAHKILDSVDPLLQTQVHSAWYKIKLFAGLAWPGKVYLQIRKFLIVPKSVKIYNTDLNLLTTSGLDPEMNFFSLQHCEQG